MSKKLSALIACLGFVFSNASDIYAAETLNYVALGDSIAAYFGLEKGQGYAELLTEKLVAEGGYTSVSLENLAQSGDDTQDLLAKIEANKTAIADADVVTICIGGNNFLGTLITGMVTPLNLSQETLVSQGYMLFNMDISDEMFALAARELQAPEIQAELAKGIARFRADLPQIITGIRDLAPNAQIYIMTVYNPLEPEHPIYPLLDPVTNQINTMIKAANDVTVVDIYAVFEEHNNTGVKDQLSLGSIDPHPSIDGHRLIANEHYKAITGKDSGDTVEITPIDEESPYITNPASEPITNTADITNTEQAPISTPEKASGAKPENNTDNLIWLISIPVLLLIIVGLLRYMRKMKK